MKTPWVLSILLFCYSINMISQEKSINSTQIIKSNDMSKKLPEEWKNTLNDEEYRVLIEKGTEYPHTGEYNMHFENGVYNCNGCKTPIFSSDQKFKSDCGWPSFDEAISGTIEKKRDVALGRIRTEIICSQCKGHLGHVFNGENYTTKNTRYCVNSLSLKFISDK